MSKILVIDDDSDIGTLVCEGMKGFHEVTSVETWAEARKRIENNNFDLVLLDLRLPDVSGWDVIEDIYEAIENVSVVIISGSDDPEDFAKAKRKNVKILTKPFRLSALLKITAELLKAAADKIEDTL